MAKLTDANYEKSMPSLDSRLVNPSDIIKAETNEEIVNITREDVDNVLVLEIFLLLWLFF